MSSPLSPAQAYARLLEGNDRFTSDSSSHQNQDAARRTELLQGQHPFAVIFGCADSRLAAEIIFDVGLGEVFVVRTAGQVIDDAVLGSLEYSVSVLGVPLIVVLGHDRCGAILATEQAVDTGEMPTGFVRDLVERITPSVLQARRQFGSESDTDKSAAALTQAAIVEHVKQTSTRLADASKLISQKIDSGELAVVGLNYRLSDGTVIPATSTPS